MENQYNYYTTDQNMNTGNYGGGGEPGKEPQKKRGKGAARWAKVVCAGLVFGVVASAAFQTSNIVAGKVLGTTQTTNKTAKTTTTSNAKLTTSTNSSIGTANVTEVTKNAMPSIVSITNMSVQEVQNFFGGTQKQESESAGSGIIIGQNDSELLIATNNHVVEDADTLSVSFVNNQVCKANIKGTDADNDLAVIAVPLSEIPDDTMSSIAVATMGDSDSVEVGEQVVAIGNALGYGQSVTTGIISAANRVIDSDSSSDGSSDGTTADTSSDSTTDSASSDSTATSSSSETTTVTVEKDLVLYVGNANEDGGSYYVKLDGSNEVHLMTASNVESFTGKKASDFWNMYIGMENVSDLTSLDITYNGETKTYVRHVEEKKDDDSDSTTQEISYTCGDETIDKSTFTTFYSSLIGLKAQTKDESLVQAKDAEFTAVFHMTDGDLTFAYSPYDSSFYYTVDEDGVPSLVNKNNVKTMLENYETLLAAKTEDDSSSDTAE